MKDLLLLSILIEKYKKQMKCIELPSTFEKKEKEEQIELLIKALENNEYRCPVCRRRGQERQSKREP